MYESSSEMSWNKFRGWSGKYMIKLAGIFNIIKEGDVIIKLYIIFVFIHVYVFQAYLYTCSVITTQSNESLSWLHHRMPILCDYDRYIQVNIISFVRTIKLRAILLQKWIDSDQLESDQILEYLNDVNSMKVADCFSLKNHAVDPKLVNNSSCDDPKCMDMVNPK